MRRYIAVSLIVFFFAYAGYLIITDGGKHGTIITFGKINANIHKKFQILMGKMEAELTPEEKDEFTRLEVERKKAEEIKRLSEAASGADVGGTGV